ncbi:MAG: outer membrane lipoprotein-sorting protein [Deltaproteobacteria bacterium]|nr:MAG: outer membrane lipoprotein-sorting protein [Deltaproteobacteria bacterium]
MTLFPNLRRTLVACLLTTGLAGPAMADDPTIEELLLATDDAQRGESSHAVMVMGVKTKRYERSMRMEAWSLGTEKSLIRILEPAKDAGITTLKVEDNLWNYLPKVDRTMKVPAGMMSGSWMGSHFSNDDLVRESRLSDDFSCEFTAKPEGGAGNYVIACTPREDAAVVWGKLVATVRADKVPVSIEYFDEDGEKVRTMTYSDVQEIAGRLTPMTMELVPHDKEGEFTRISFETLEIDVPLEDKLFTLQALKQ